MTGIEIASNVLSNVLDHSCELGSVFMVEKFWQRHGPVEPGVQDVGLFRIVGGDEVIHRGDIATRSNLDLLSRLDGERRESVCFGADLVCGNGADGVHRPCVVPEAVNFLPGGGDSEFAVVFDKGRTAQVKGS